MIDLHTHTTCSDGDKSPEKLVSLCAARGISVVAITDHDTVAGVAEAVAAGERYGVTVVPGVELSAVWQGDEVHLLGLMVDPTDAALLDYCERMQQIRRTRGTKIIAKLRGFGIEIAPEEEREACDSRAKIGGLLVQKGVVPNMRAAFQKYLSTGAAAFVEKERIEVSDAIQMVHHAGGLAIVAHLITISKDEKRLREMATMMKADGLDGLECYYGEYTKEFSTFCCGLADELGLLKSGGSDYHGDRKKGLHLGTGYGSLHIPESVYEKMREKKETHRMTTG